MHVLRKKEDIDIPAGWAMTLYLMGRSPKDHPCIAPNKKDLIRHDAVYESVVHALCTLELRSLSDHVPRNNNFHTCVYAHHGSLRTYSSEQFSH